MKMTAELELLNEGLADFGLCPIDWVVTEEDDLFYKIINIEEPYFYFKGTVRYENGNKKWNAITLAGI